MPTVTSVTYFIIVTMRHMLRDPWAVTVVSCHHFMLLVAVIVR